MKHPTFSTCVLSLLLFIATALALVAAPAEPAPAATGPTLMMNWSALWITVLVPILVAILKTLWPSVPKAALPVLCPVLGGACGLVATLNGNQIDPAVAAALGALGTWLRECYDQATKYTAELKRDTGTRVPAAACAALMLYLVAGPTSAQAAQTEWLGAAPETRFSVSPFASYRAHEVGKFNGKWGGGLAAAVHLNRWIALEAETIAERLDDSVWTGSLTEFGANFKTSLLPTKAVNPYLLIGYTRNLDQCDNRMNAGAGLEIRLGKHGALFADGRWTHNFEVLGHALFRTGFSVRF